MNCSGETGMNKSPAFTLLEVLLAIVLLALVVGVCTPYLRPSTPQTDLGGLSEFVVQVNEAINRAQREDSRLLNLGQLEALVSSHGWRIEPVTPVDPGWLDGQWVTISDGDNTLCRWARIDQGGKP